MLRAAHSQIAVQTPGEQHQPTSRSQSLKTYPNLQTQCLVGILALVSATHNTFIGSFYAKLEVPEETGARVTIHERMDSEGGPGTWLNISCHP